MRTVRTKVYKFSELSKQAQNNAIEWYKDNALDNNYLYEEAYDSLKKFAALFSINIRNYDFGEHYRSRYTFELDDTILELSGWRLVKYIWNNFRSDIYKQGKYYKSWESEKYICHPHVKSQSMSKENGWSNPENFGKYWNAYYGSILEDYHCVFTGVCWDDDLLDPIYKFMKQPTDSTFKDLLEDCLTSLNKSVTGEDEARQEDDFIADEIEANDYEFTKDGEVFNR